MAQALDVIWVDSDEALGALIADLDGLSRVAIDTEFHGERSYIPHLMLVQIASEQAIYLVDPLAEIDLQSLFSSLARPELLVIGHALHNDLEIVYRRHGLAVSSVFDTQVAGAFLGHGLQIGLTALVRTLLRVKLAKGSQMSDWSRRPLPDRQLQYAANDVRFLLALHDKMSAALERRGRTTWVSEECARLEDGQRYARDPMDAHRRVSGGRNLRPHEAGILVELAAERDYIAAELDKVPHFVFSDDILVALSRRAPKTIKDMSSDRRLRNRQVQRHADRLLSAIERGRGKPWKRPSGRPPAGAGVEAVAALIMLMVGQIATSESLAPALLLKRKIVQSALQDGDGDRESLLDALALHGWRRALLGDAIWELVDGERAAVCRRDKGGLYVAFEGHTGG